MPQGALAKDELRGVCTVETIHAVGPADPILEKHLASPYGATCPMPHQYLPGKQTEAVHLARLYKK
jgi:hypothetical protein